MAEVVKLSFNATLLRVKIELTRALCGNHETPPADIIARAKAKMESVKASGETAFYLVYETRLVAAWQAMRENTSLPEDFKVVVTVAAGAPALTSIKIEKATNDKAVALLTIDATTETMKTWQYEWFKLFVMKKIRDLEIKEYINNAQLLGCFLRAKNGEKIVSSPLSAIPNVPVGSGPKAFSILANKARREIAVMIRDVVALTQKEPRDQMLSLINHSVRQLSGNGEGVVYRVLKQEFLGGLHSALAGPELLGLDVPFMLLAAIGHEGQAGTRPNQAKTADESAATTVYPGAGKLNIVVSPDRMLATIGDFDMALYDDSSFEVNLDWVERELKRNGIKVEMPDDFKKILSEALVRHESLAGKELVRGEAGRGGKGPKLYKSYKDASARVAANLDNDNLDIREMQQRMIVKTGQLVAEIRYSDPAVPGRNVLGEEIASPPNDELILKIGEGVQQRNQRFYATMDGLPSIDSDSISLSKVLIHSGDVNLRTGNIRFDGPIEIMGSIDSGAIVETTGDLLVHGTIRGGFVKASGNIAVNSGIVMGGKGTLQARGDVRADFVENSSIVCGGNLIVSKAIINSQVICGGSIQTLAAATGVIAGGRLSCKNNLITQNLGFKRGATTALNVGVDWRIAQAVDVSKSRLEKLQKKLAEDRQSLRELVQRSKAQMTQRHQDLKDHLQGRLTRGRIIIEKLEKRLAAAQSKLTYNADSRIIVSELLTSSVQIIIGGQVVAVTNDVAGVGVLPKRRRGNFIVPIEEVEEEMKANGKLNKAS